MSIPPHDIRPSRPLFHVFWSVLAVALALAGATGAQSRKDGAQSWQPLFEGKTLGNWQPTAFGGHGDVKVDEGRIVLEMGAADLTGITWAGAALPTTDYEIALRAIRLDGNDFFAGVTFPVADSFCSLILGGWGGSTVGLSSIEGRDASENETTRTINFETGRWYDVRIRVTATKIEAWLDRHQVVDADIKGKTISTRPEVDLSKPLGIAAWRTRSALRDIRLRKLS